MNAALALLGLPTWAIVSIFVGLGLLLVASGGSPSPESGPRFSPRLGGVVLIVLGVVLAFVLPGLR
jgi:hypothetical protein